MLATAGTVTDRAGRSGAPRPAPGVRPVVGDDQSPRGDVGAAPTCDRIATMLESVRVGLLAGEHDVMPPVACSDALAHEVRHAPSVHRTFADR